MARRRRVLAWMLVACWLVTGCGGDEGGGAAAGTTTATGGSTSTTTVAPTSSNQAATTTEGFSGVVVEAKVTGGKVETANRRVRVDRGEAVRIRVESDRNEEVHVHGYDLSRDVAPGKPATIEFTADAPGVFEVELEATKLLLFELQVQ